MHVIATAGHVDHGKSALLKALTGMEPDRWEEERRRGLTIDLGFVWTDSLAFVDVPGHERFVGNMLAGIGPVPAVLFVVAADEGWMPQSQEHLVALDSLGVQHGLLVITKTDVMDPSLAAADALDHLRNTSLHNAPWIGVSARTGSGIPELRTMLSSLVSALPPSDPCAPVRLWADRAFTIRGAGLVVTGTLNAGTIKVGDTLELASTGKRYPIREIQSLSQHVDAVTGVSRVALNLRGAHRGDVSRGDALMTPGTYRLATVIDIRTRLCAPSDLPSSLTVHIGSAAVPASLRPLGLDTARLTLSTSLPLRIGDRLVLRHSSGVAGGASVLDTDPPRLTRRGAAKSRAEDLISYPSTPDGEFEVRRRGFARKGQLLALGVAAPFAPVAGDWLADPALVADLSARLASLAQQRFADPSLAPLKADDAVKMLGLPDPHLLDVLLSDGLTVRNGMIVRADAPDTLASSLRDQLDALELQFSGQFTVVDSLSPADAAAAVRSGRMVRLLPDVVLLSSTVGLAVDILSGLAQPFTVSEAREALGSTRKVVVPLLEYLARTGKTRRDPDGRHHLA